MKRLLLLMLLSTLLLLTGCIEIQVVDTTNSNTSEEPAATPSSPSAKTMTVHFLNVGQGDSMLIQSPSGKTMLIDGGVKGAGPTVVDYIRAQGVKRLDYVVATHPDADHIGGLITVLNSISIGQFIDSGKVHTSQTFEEMLTLIQQKNIPYIVPQTGDTIDFDPLLDVTVISADEHADDNNEASIVLKMVYNQVSFLFAGDAGIAKEKEIVKYADVRATVLKAGHHGSNTSSSRSFLNSVKPEVTIFSYGQDNKYGHPHAEVVNELKKIKSKLYGTAEAGHIVVTTDGLTYNVDAAEWTGIGATSSLGNKPSTKRGVEIVSKDLQQEIVVIQNYSEQDVSLEGWQLVSVNGNQVFNFPATTLKAGAKLSIVSGTDAVATKTKLLWTNRAIWANDGDAAQLLNAKGEIVSELD